MHSVGGAMHHAAWTSTFNALRISSSRGRKVGSQNEGESGEQRGPAGIKHCLLAHTDGLGFGVSCQMGLVSAWALVIRHAGDFWVVGVL